MRSTIALAVLAAVACSDTAKTAAPVEAAPAEAAPVEVAGEISPLAAPAARPMLLVFSRDYCTPCQIMKPWVAEVATEAATANVDVVTLNVDRKKYENLGSFFKISAVPTIVYLQADGQVARRTDGLAKKSQMMRALHELGWLL